MGVGTGAAAAAAAAWLGAAGAAGSRGSAPLLLLCWLCCWPDDPSSDTSSSGKHQQKPVAALDFISRRRRSGAAAAASEPLPPRRAATSVVSLHLPSTSGHEKQPLSAHRSHEEIPSRRRSNLEPSAHQERYHSAPSVIHEVLHRRDWEKSTRDLYIPLKPDVEPKHIDSDTSSPEPSHVEQQSSSIEGLKSDERLNCKKHYTNIKSSRNRTKKESTREDVKDVDTTEGSITNFYVGDANADSYVSSSTQDMINNDVISNDRIKSVYETEDVTKSIKRKDRSTLPNNNTNIDVLKNDYFVERSATKMFELVSPDRSGAERRRPASRSRNIDAVCSSRASYLPPSSVEAVGYECLVSAGEGDGGEGGGELWAAGAAAAGLRARHASTGDILAPALRPQSCAFSESDLDLELESGDERPPPYEELAGAGGGRPPPPPSPPPPPFRETAI